MNKIIQYVEEMPNKLLENRAKEIGKFKELENYSIFKIMYEGGEIQYIIMNGEPDLNSLLELDEDYCDKPKFVRIGSEPFRYQIRVDKILSFSKLVVKKVKCDVEQKIE